MNIRGTFKMIMLLVKKIAIFSAFISLSIWASSNGAESSKTLKGKLKACTIHSGIQGGGAIPWPWGSELDFPWESIEGTWRPVRSDCDSYFVVQATHKSAIRGAQVMRVTQFDHDTCERISWGVGTERERVLHVSMKDVRGTYGLTIRSFTKSSANNLRTNIDPELNSTIVLTMFPKYDLNERISFELEKVSDGFKPQCEVVGKRRRN